MDFIILIFLAIILNFGKCATNGPFSSETFLSEENCSIDGSTSDSKFWAWIRQQNDDEQDDGIVRQFLEDLEREEQNVLFPPPVIHPIAEKYTHQKYDPYENKSSIIETSDDEKQITSKNGDRKWTNSFKRIFQFSENNISAKVENESKINQKSGELEKFENLMQTLRYDANMLKKAAFLGGQCAVKVASLFLNIKHRLNLAVDLVAPQFGIIEIVPAKIPFSNGKILKILALKWMKLRKLKNEKGNGKKRQKKQKKFVEELLKLIKGFLEGPQFDMLTSNGHASKGQKKRRRRRGTNVGLIIAIAAGAFCIIMLIASAIVVINQRNEARAKGAELAAKATPKSNGKGGKGAGPAKNGGDKANESPAPSPSPKCEAC